MAGEFRVTGGDDLRRLARQLEKANLTPELDRELRRIGGPIVADVQAQIAAIPTQGTKHTGLRARMIAATEQFVTVGRSNVKLRIQTHPGKGGLPEAGQRAMPVAMEMLAFIHPVYAHMQRRVIQRGHPYLRGTVRRHIPQARAAVERAADTVALKLSRS